MKFIPQREIKNRKGTLPWLDDKCRNAVAVKNAVEGTDEYEIACLACIKVLGEAHAKYIAKIKAKLQTLPRRSI